MLIHVLVDLRTNQRYVLHAGTLVAGRNESSPIYLPDPTCSRTHFQLELDENSCQITPLAPANPTFLNGQEIDGSARLTDDAIIQAGNTRLRFVAANYESTTPAVTPLESHTILADGASRGTVSLDQPIRLQEGRLTIGRDGDCAVSFVHPQVSRLHAAVTVQGEQVTIVDLGSANGTFVNGERLPPGVVAKLRPGDHLDIGPFGLTVARGSLTPRSRVNNIEIVGSTVSRVVTDRQTGQPLKLLDQVSLVVRPKEFVCLLGPSGSGKTTLMGLLSGRVKPDDGAVLVNGQDLHAQFEALKKDIAYVQQKDVMHDKLTVGETLAFTGLLRLPPDLSAEERRSGIDDILHTVALADRRGTLIHQLSGGQLKRASLANEILSQPSLLFLDEVTSGLDEQTDRDMMALFRRVADAGKTVICITHSLTNIEDYCDLVVILTPGGKTAFVGTPAEAGAYFGIARLGDVYARLAESPAEEWQRRFRQSPYYRRYVEERLKAAVAPTRVASTAPTALAAQAKNSLRQSLLLTWRYLLIWRSSPGALLSMIGQTLLISVLLILVFGNVSDIKDSVKQVNRTENLIFLLAVSAFWLGCNNSAKELVKERTIFRRERDYNLLVSSYLASKLFVLASMGVLQILLLFGLVHGFCDPPGSLVQQALLMVLLSCAGTALGLAISASAGSEEVAIALIPVAVIPQIILSGAIAPLSGLTRWLALLGVTTYWGKLGFDQLLPADMLTLARNLDLAGNGNYYVTCFAMVAHAAIYVVVSLLVLQWRGRSRT